MSAVLPLPIFKGVNEITDVDLGTPGQLKLDTQGKLLREYLKYAGFTLPYRLAYDNWLQNILPLQIKTFVFNTKDGIISHVDVSYRSPYNDNTTNKPIYPKQVRENEGTYELKIFVKYKFTPVRNGVLQNDKAEISDFKEFGKIPLMLGTKYCHLWNKTDAEIVALGECPCDPLGYFIINGTEKLIILQEKVRVNRVILSYDKNLNTPIASYTINTYKGPKKIYVLANKFDEIQLHFVGLNNNPINLFIAFRFLGIDDIEVVVQMIKYFIPEKYHRKINPFLLLTISQSGKISDKYEYVSELIGDSKNVPREDKVRKIDNILNDNLYPNMNIHNTVGENNFTKATMLAQQSAIFIQYKLGITKIDDRDNYSNKRIESAGRLMEQLFTSLLVSYVTKMQSQIDAEGIGKRGLEISFDKNYIGENFVKAFGTESWGAPGTTQKENVTDILKRESVNSTLAQLTRINIPTVGYNSSIEPRLVHPSQLGYICGVTSPEGERAGLIKSIAITCYPSIEKSPTLLIQNMLEYKCNFNTGEKDVTGENLMVSIGTIVNNAYTFNSNVQRPILVLINGIPRGWVNMDIGYEYVRFLRRTGVYPELTVVKIPQYKVLDIYTDGARPLRPLLIVDPVDNQVVALKNGYLEPSRINELVKTGSLIDFLLKNGAMEYVDAYEQDKNVYLAQTFSQIQGDNNDLIKMENNFLEAEQRLLEAGITDPTETKDDLPDEDGNYSIISKLKQNYNSLLNKFKRLASRPKFTHCELDPTSILGQTASTIPLASSNVAPRNMFTTGMTNQSLGIYHSNQDRRFDTAVKTLAYPTRPIFETQANEAIGTDELPNGVTVKVATMSWSGFNQEDAFIFNRQSIDNGLFTTVKYFTYKTSTYSVNKQYTEKYKKPAKLTKEMEHKLRNIGDNGLPLEGSYMEEGDVVISKVRIIGDKEVFVGETIGIGDEGTVHRIKVSKNTNKNEVVRVMIRQIRTPQVGDKFASRSAQKGTIGLILSPEEMPYIAYGPDAGTSPDIIINSHALPSRMTIGKLVEIVATKVGLIKGERMNATSFRPIDHKDIEVTLRQYGYNPKGNEIMINPLNGEEIPGEIYVGPCYYSSLGKDVKDKIQVRNSAGIDPSSHEPTRGRTNASGKAVRVGTQESTSFVGHNAPSILRERLNDSSDGFNIVVCKTCGTIATHNVELKSIRCRKCGTNGNFGQVTIPGSYKLITQILWGMNINQTLGLSETHQKI